MTDLALAKIEGDEIVIRVPIGALNQCVQHVMGGLGEIYEVTDAPVFAKEFVNALNAENEIGDTVIHLAFDKAIETAIENGCEGVTP